jgi:hypothetical protein
MNFYTFSVAISLECKNVKRLKLKPKALRQLFPCVHLISGMRSFLGKCCPVAVICKFPGGNNAVCGEISDSHSDEYGDGCLLGCCAV